MKNITSEPSAYINLTELKTNDMSAPNFAYENRCIVVADEDYESGNYPMLGEIHDSADRDYHRVHLKGYEGYFTFWDLVLTVGYYSGACIDFVESRKFESIYDVCSPSSYTNVDEFCRDLFREFNGVLTLTKIRSFFKGRDPKTDDMEIFLDERYQACYEAAKEAEKPKLNKALDEIVEVYGFTEYTKTAQFSNGEAIYSPISK